MTKIAIIAALPDELKPLVRGWKQHGRNRWTGRIHDNETMAVAGGMGAAAAQRVTKQILEGFAANALISYGWAGALTCAVKPPEAFAISEVIDDVTGDRFTTGNQSNYRLITLDHVAHAKEKRALAQKHQAVLVDMEAASVARVAATQNLAFYCFKGISDGYSDRLPDFSRFISPAGELQMAAFLTHISVRPQYWPSLQRLGRNSRSAALALVEALKDGLKAAPIRQ